MTRSIPTGRMRWPSILGVLALLCAVGGCGGASGGTSSGNSIKVLLQPAAWSSAALIAQKKGYFKDEGLDVQLQTVANQAAQVPLLVSNRAQIAVGSNIATAIAVGQGLPFQIIATATRNETSSANASDAIIVKSGSDVTSAADLVGKKVAMGALKGASEYLVRVAIDTAGKDGNDVQLVQLDQAAGVAALDKGEVDAALVFQPFLAQALAKGYKVISYPSLASAPGKMFTDWYATKEFLAKNPDTAKKFDAAIQKADDYANQHPDEANALIASELSMPADVAAQLPTTSYGGAVDGQQVQDALDAVKKYGWNEKDLPPASDMIWNPS